MNAGSNYSRGESTRQAILDTAKELFFKQGYNATGMRELAKEVGITPAAIYNHFAGKEEIFMALLKDAAPYDQIMSLPERLDAATPSELIAVAVRGILQLFSEHQDYLRLSLIDAQEREGAAILSILPVLAPHMFSFYQKFAALDGSGEKVRQLPPYIFLRTFVSLVFGFIITEHVARPALTLNLPEADWVQGLIDIFSYGVIERDKED